MRTVQRSPTPVGEQQSRASLTDRQRRRSSAEGDAIYFSWQKQQQPLRFCFVTPSNFHTLNYLRGSWPKEQEVHENKRQTPASMSATHTHLY